ncbi:hypothetical protein Dda_5222 [Drechslerella dactyloides]|uniref:NAD(P)-binding protein n=1 Tax=Drechslerella dactyloides TaxID=74499 RepID=A0AAD6NIH4_DREDA|nr:hypothetical protein Dda_5222 [Drechslerella dactyloides]
MAVFHATASLFQARWLLGAEIFPPKPQFEEKDVHDLSGKVYFVTGAAAGIGLELAKILYSKNAKVYIAGRSEANGAAAIAQIKSEHPKSDGALEFVHLDLADLTTIKPAADVFLAKEKRLDALVHNAAIMAAPTSWRSAQGWDVQFGTNVLGPFVLQRHLQNILAETAKFRERDSVRVLFLSSISSHVAPPGGVSYENIETKGISPLTIIPGLDTFLKYAQTKCANALMAKGFAVKFKDTGVIAVSANPGNLNTSLTRHSLLARIFSPPLLYAARYGALTELFSILSPEIDKSQNGAVIQPWGRISFLRQDIHDSEKNGEAVKFWDWLEEHTQGF